MALTEDQKRFIELFVLDGECSLHKTCIPLGIRPSEAHKWFRDSEFNAAKRRAEGAILLGMGMSQMRLLREIWAIATSNIADVTIDQERGIRHLPRHVTAGIKTLKGGVAMMPDGTPYHYPKEITMRDSIPHQKLLADMLETSQAPEIQAMKAVLESDGPARISGVVMRPPLSIEDAELEDLLS